MNPLLKYRGGKSREIPSLLEYIPNDFNTYIEPFFGGGALYFYLEPNQSIINDINSPLMQFYYDVQANYPTMRIQLDELQRQYEENQDKYKRMKSETPNVRVPNDNETLYYHMRYLFNHPDNKYLYGVLYYFINKTSYSGMIRYNRNGEYNVPYGRYPNFNTKNITEYHSILLQHTKIYNQDYESIFEMANTNDFIFLDPPYDCIFNDYGNNDMLNGFDESEHIRLANDFKNLSCRALMVIGKTPLTQELYNDYIIDEYQKNYSVNIRNRFNRNSTHLIVKNY